MLPRALFVTLYAIALLVHKSYCQGDPFAGFGFDSYFPTGDDDDGSSHAGSSGGGTAPRQDETNSPSGGAPETAAAYGVPPPYQPLLPEPCRDEVTYCAAYRDYGYCNPTNRYYSYMEMNCKESCGLCPSIQPTPTPGPGIPCARVVCDFIVCAADEVLSQNEYECCPYCVKRPEQGCTPVFKQAPLRGVDYFGYKCNTQGAITQSACFGVCASASVQLLSGREYQRCQCCKSDRTEMLSTLIQCPHQSTPIRYDYEVITSCDCSECDASGGGSSGGFMQNSVAAMVIGESAGGSGGGDGSDSAEVQEFGGMFDKVDIFNQ